MGELRETECHPIEKRYSNADKRKVTYGSLNCPACSCVSVTLPASSQTRITAQYEAASYTSFRRWNNALSLRSPKFTKTSTRYSAYANI
jgi:hypothetical protein